jgi:hypothetical protein
MSESGKCAVFIAKLAGDHARTGSGTCSRTRGDCFQPGYGTYGGACKQQPGSGIVFDRDEPLRSRNQTLLPA